MSEVVRDHTKAVIESLKALAASHVLIGIPEENIERDDDEEHGPINNAALGYIHEHGSPAANIPARPFLIPGVEQALPKVQTPLRKAAIAALSGDMTGLENNLHIAGTIARDEVKFVLNTADFVPLADSTLRNRARRSGSSIAAAARRELASRAAGNSPGIDEARPLVETGQMRNAITYVVTQW